MPCDQTRFHREGYTNEPNVYYRQNFSRYPPHSRRVDQPYNRGVDQPNRRGGRNKATRMFAKIRSGSEELTEEYIYITEEGMSGGGKLI